MYTNTEELTQTTSSNDPLSIIDQLIRTAVFSEDEMLKEQSRTTIRDLANKHGIHLATTKPLYEAIGEEQIGGFTIPAINIRTLTYDISCLIFSLMKKHAVGCVVLEIARSEMEYTYQDSAEFAVSVLAGAIKADYTGLIFLQADHYQVRKKRYAEDPEAELASIKELLTKALAAGFYNIDIDGSTIVDLEKPTVIEQQAANVSATTTLAQFILDNKPEGQEISIGAEIGHIGDTNSTKEDLTTFMEGAMNILPEKTITKISIQTGTSHGGNVQPDGSLAEPAIDFSLLDSLGAVARQDYHLGGVVQHGASTLPLRLFSEFAKVRTLEIHLSTALQNIVYDNLPETTRATLYQWVDANCQHERKTEWTNEQFYYKTRKKALGPNKQLLWNMTDEEKAPIKKALTEYFETLFTSLAVVQTKDKIQSYYP